MTRAVKLSLVGALLLVLLVPHLMISGVISERQSFQEDARADIAHSWGPAQSVFGPILVIPTRTAIVARKPDETGPVRYERGAIAVLPSDLAMDAKLQPERRTRGLFGAVVYNADVALDAHLAVPALDVPRDTEVLWREAFLATGGTDLRSAASGARLTVDNRALEPGDAGDGACAGADPIAWKLGWDGPPAPGQVLALAGTLSVRGTGRLGLLPLARRARLAASAPWPSPSFNGTGLPVRKDISDAGFTASWEEGTGQALVRRVDNGWCQSLVLNANDVGVELIEAVPTYQMVSRASKYAVMFLALSFLTYALFELVAGVRIHLVQYGLLGLSVVLFPLLLLAFAEPLGFTGGYAVGTLAVLAQASAFTAAVTRRAGLAAVFAAVLGGLFAFLYVVLRLDTYALLAGTVVLFAALSAVMAVTRRIDWSS